MQTLKSFVKQDMFRFCARGLQHCRPGQFCVLSWLCSTTFCFTSAWGAMRWPMWLAAGGTSTHRDVRLEGGPLHCKRVSSRSHSEPVSFPAVACYSWWHQSKRDIELGGCMLGRTRAVLVKGSLHFWWINSSFGFGGFCLSRWLSIPLEHTFHHRGSQTVTPRRGCCFPVGPAITDMQGRIKHSSFCLGLKQSLQNSKACSCKGIDTKTF